MWSVGVKPRRNEMVPPQHAPEYVKRDGTSLRHEYGNFDHGPDNILSAAHIGVIYLYSDVI